MDDSPVTKSSVVEVGVSSTSESEIGNVGAISVKSFSFVVFLVVSLFEFATSWDEHMDLSKSSRNFLL